MRQMRLIKGICDEDLMNRYNEVARELGNAIIHEESAGEYTIRIYFDDKKTSKGEDKPVVKEGTCSACPNFQSRRDDRRGQYVKWGTCTKMMANVNEHKPCCSMYLKEIEKWKEVNVDIREAQEVRRLYVG